jgi:hypothetical protein
MKTIEIPTNLNLEDLLRTKYPEFYSHLDKFYYLIHIIRMKWFSDNRYNKLKNISKNARKKNFIPLHNEHLRNLFGTHYAKRILEILISEEILETNNQYIITKSSKGYRLSEKYLDSEVKSYTIKEKKIVEKIIEKEKQDYNYLSEVNKQILEMIKTKFTFDLQNAFKLSTQQKHSNIVNNSHRYVFNQLTQLQNGNFYLTSSEKTGRIFHNYSNLKKDLRYFIQHISKEKLIEIDIANSQPFFLGCIVSQLDQTPDTKEFIEIVSKGKFYDYLRNSIDNNLSKENVLTLLYCPSHWNVKHKDRFTELFPTVSKTIELLKGTDYKNIAIELQSREADMILTTIAPILLDKQIDFIPIHDSFMIRESEREIVLQIINDEFLKKYNMIPTLKIK